MRGEKEMFKKFCFYMLPSFIYNILVFLLMLSSLFIPVSADVNWLWTWGFYIPYLFWANYFISFVLGFYVQERSNTRKFKTQLLLSLISFFITLFNLLIPDIRDWGALMSSPLRQTFIFTLYPALGSSILFLLAQIIKMHRQKKQ